MKHNTDVISLNIYKIANNNFSNRSINNSLYYLIKEYNASKAIIKCKNDDNTYKIKYMVVNNDRNNKNNISEINFKVDNKIYTLSIYDSNGITDKALYEYANIYKDLINNINTVDKLINKAYISDIANLYNRRYLNDIIIPNINNMSNNYINNKLDASVSYGDLYRLKYINDNLGHDTGDEYILGISEILKKHFTDENDYVVHVSGDEFVIVSLFNELKEINNRIQLIENDVISTINYKNDNENIKGYINFGTSFREYGPVNLKNMISEADTIMNNNKSEFYNQQNTIRRK